MNHKDRQTKLAQIQGLNNIDLCARVNFAMVEQKIKESPHLNILQVWEMKETGEYQEWINLEFLQLAGKSPASFGPSPC